MQRQMEMVLLNLEDGALKKSKRLSKKSLLLEENQTILKQYFMLNNDVYCNPV